MRFQSVESSQPPARGSTNSHTSGRRAVVPTRILLKWDAIAAAQLCEAVSRQAEEMDRLRSDIAHSDSLLDFWHEQAVNLQDQLCELSGGEPGITQGCQLVVVPAEHTRASPVHVGVAQGEPT